MTNTNQLRPAELLQEQVEALVDRWIHREEQAPLSLQEHISAYTEWMVYVDSPDTSTQESLAGSQVMDEIYTAITKAAEEALREHDRVAAQIRRAKRKDLERLRKQQDAETAGMDLLQIARWAMSQTEHGAPVLATPLYARFNYVPVSRRRIAC